ncbi:MAG: CbiX/SirB N-terminal domain-containing protein [Azovibrio sp.]|uniref:sirohydrochlorin chelatase n=1 Tax=Azovibrio sp. TaxID=1872673 RepID=UPI003C72B9A5
MRLRRRGLVLLGHGARDPEWAEPLRDVRRRIQAQIPTARIELAFLEFMEPDLEAVVTALVAEGCASITVLPMFIAQGGHLKRDLPVTVAHLQAVHPCTVIELGSAIGTAEPVLAAMADYAGQLLD